MREQYIYIPSINSNTFVKFEIHFVKKLDTGHMAFILIPYAHLFWDTALVYVENGLSVSDHIIYNSSW